MKKLITLCIFTIAMLLTTNISVAQNKIEINQTAFEKADELYKTIKFNTDVRDEVYEALKVYELKMYNFKKIEEEGNTVNPEDIKQVKAALTEKFKTLFTEEQFDLYTSLQNQ